eukprot:6729100-Pyramimonas_sp.AAC.1
MSAPGLPRQSLRGTRPSEATLRFVKHSSLRFMTKPISSSARTTAMGPLTWRGYTIPLGGLFWCALL